MIRRSLAVPATLACALALAACRGDDADRTASAGDAGLPAPTASAGSVTGMPGTPGPGTIGTPRSQSGLAHASSIVGAGLATSTSLPPPAMVAGDANPTAPAAGTGGEPDPGDAVQVLRDYYAAIAMHDFGKAYRLWSEDGRASGQSAQGFAAGFADTTSVAVEVGTPGDEDAGAGQRYIEVPVTVTATHADGSRHRYAGSYVLHRAVADGASAGDRAWRIASAKLRETGVP